MLFYRHCAQTFHDSPMRQDYRSGRRKIIEDGTYDELIAKKGNFYELVERQRLDH